jgi:putative hydrolase of the HAD superfamily
LTTSAVLIDLYETLVTCDFEPLHAVIAEQLDVPFGVVRAAYDATRHDRGTGRYPSPEAALGSIVTTCGRDADPALLARLAVIERDFLAGAVQLYPDSLDTVRWLRDAGVRTALVSNCSPATGAVVDDLQLGAELDVIVLSFEVGALKPAPEIFLDALERLDAAPAECWFIDDQVSYCDGARRLGIRAVRIVRGKPGAATGDAGDPRVESLTAARDYLGIG